MDSPTGRRCTRHEELGESTKMSRELTRKQRRVCWTQKTYLLDPRTGRLDLTKVVEIEGKLGETGKEETQEHQRVLGDQHKMAHVHPKCMEPVKEKESLSDGSPAAASADPDEEERKRKERGCPPTCGESEKEEIDTSIPPRKKKRCSRKAMEAASHHLGVGDK